MLQLGWKAGTEQYPPVELLEYALVAEDAGFDSIDASDHFHPWAEKGQACFVWSWLGAVAAKTNKITIGTGVTCPTLRYHPAVIAQAAATVACLAPGRFYLGVGTGEALNEYSATFTEEDTASARATSRESQKITTLTVVVRIAAKSRGSWLPTDCDVLRSSGSGYKSSLFLK